MNKFNTLVAAIEGIEDVEMDYDHSTVETVMMYVPRSKEDAVFEAEENNLAVISSRYVYPEGMEHTRVVLTGSRFNLNEYACTTDAYESPSMEFSLEDFKESERMMQEYALKRA